MVAQRRRELDVDLENACLRALATEYDQINYDLFKNLLRRPEIRLGEGRSRLGTWEGSPPTITLARHLVLERPWGTLVEVLKHEMAHQFVSQVLGVEEPPHGPAFAQVCRERGIDARASGEIQTNDESGGSRGILAKVAALLSLAESSNPHEAEVAMSTAQRLMLKHNLAHVGKKESEGYYYAHLGTATGRVEESQRVVASILRDFFFVETLWVTVFRPLEGKWGSVLEVCGTQENVALAEYVHGFLTHTAARLWRAHQRTTLTRSNRDRRKFVAGVMAGFHTKLERERGRNREQGLLWVGDEKLKAFFRRRYPRVRSISYGTSRSSAAYDRGHAEGERIVLHKGVSTSKSGGTKLLGS